MLIYKTIEIRYLIRDYPYYGFGDDKLLYNLRTGKMKKQSLNGGSIGYWLGRKFITLYSLKPRLYKPEKEILPF